ncbi:uncharacterized protein LOC100374730 [Saccoglossus kowalevskii]|uniref:Uncharacterized protein LOC100374730 n=1 Tax=Saccoglossus kowalevskii TaxID=10224 RepID=A0ABM0GRX5_SACKO|nr:PREDICTED: uncharacterized protein LOC100374730 [Saccoglossus kowalevskii]
MATSGFSMRSMAKGMRSVLNIYNMDMSNPASAQVILKAVTTMNEDIQLVETQMNDLVVEGNIQDDATLVLHKHNFIGATSIIKESLCQLGNIVRLAATLTNVPKETNDCMYSMVDSVKRQFNYGFDQAKESFSALRQRVNTTPRLQESQLIQKILEEIGDNIEFARANDEVEERLNCLDNVRQGQEALNNAVDEVMCNDCPEGERQQLRQIQHEMNVGTKMWDMVFYIGHVMVFILTLGASVNRAS